MVIGDKRQQQIGARLPCRRQAVRAADHEDQMSRPSSISLHECQPNRSARPAGSSRIFVAEGCFSNGSKRRGSNLPHLAFGETRGALDVFLGHGVGVRVARLADVVEKQFQVFLRKNGMPSRSSTNSTASPICTRSPGDARPSAACRIERDDRQLIRSVGDELLRRGEDQRFGVNRSRSRIHTPPPESSPRPSRRSRPDFAPGRANAAQSAARPLRRGSASPRRRSAPRRSRPPDGPWTSARRWYSPAADPSAHVQPCSAYGPPSPFLTKPRSSVAIISAMVKQSCTSANWMSLRRHAGHFIRLLRRPPSRREKW